MKYCQNHFVVQPYLPSITGRSKLLLIVNTCKVKYYSKLFDNIKY